MLILTMILAVSNTPYCQIFPEIDCDIVWVLLSKCRYEGPVAPSTEQRVVLVEIDPQSCLSCLPNRSCWVSLIFPIFPSIIDLFSWWIALPTRYFSRPSPFDRYLGWLYSPRPNMSYHQWDKQIKYDVYNVVTGVHHDFRQHVMQ